MVTHVQKVAPTTYRERNSCLSRRRGKSPPVFAGRWRTERRWCSFTCIAWTTYGVFSAMHFMREAVLTADSSSSEDRFARQRVS